MRVLPPPVSEATESFELECISEELSASALIPIPTPTLRPLPPPPSLPRSSYPLPPAPSRPHSTLPPAPYLPPPPSHSTLPPAPYLPPPPSHSTLPPAPYLPPPPRLPAPSSVTVRRDTAPPVETTRVLPLTAVGEASARPGTRISGVARAYVAALGGMVLGALFVVGVVKLAADAPAAPTAASDTLVIPALDDYRAPPPSVPAEDVPVSVSALPVLPSEEPAAPPPARRPLAPARASATLSFNSVPLSSVVLDGRPLGRTPRLGVRVTPGAHSVVFIQKERGRVSRSVFVGAGSAQTVAVRFPSR
jgi:hypothetical protein